MAMEAKVREAARKARKTIRIFLEQDIDALLRRRLSHTPALEVNGRLVVSGRVPFVAELVELFSEEHPNAIRQLEFAPDNLTRINSRSDGSHGIQREMDVALRNENPEAMNTPITWIVGLDFSAMDRDIIDYTASLADQLGPDKIYFLHVYPNLDLPDAAREALREPELPLDERLVRDMQLLLREEFPDAARYEAECQVVEGKAESQLLRWAHIKSADLLIMGRKQNPGSSGVIPKRVARKAECSVLFVPEKPRFGLNTLLVPTDFSEPSARALSTANWIQEHLPDAETFLFHSCHLPSSIYYDGLAGANMVDLLQEAAEEQMEAFKVQQKSPDARVMVDAQADRSVSLSVAETSRSIGADMVIIGGKGRSGLAGAIIGSVTESLLQAISDTPVWVAKAVHRPTTRNRSASVAGGSRA
jgi:nucleotide-binding universal stress UspA family protein